MASYRLFITGFPGSGKTEFMKSISDFPPVSILKKVVTLDKSIPMIYGRVYLSGEMVYMYCPESWENTYQVSDMWESFSTEMQASVLVVDSTNYLDIKRSKELLEILQNTGTSPCIVIPTKVDIKDTMDPNEIQNILKIDVQRLIPCVAIQQGSVRQAFENILRIITTKT